MPNMPDGDKGLVLRACDKAPKDSFDYVRDDAIVSLTQLSIQVVRDCFLSLEKEEKYLSVVRKNNPDRFEAFVTETGRLALDQFKPFKQNEDGHESDPKPIEIVPKGLLSYDAEDKDFFLDLLPGARRADGLPDSIHFWKTRIEGMDPDKTFSVGVIYGTSGCGKSSLVKAGLLPRLSDRILRVYVEATANQTESHLLKGIRRQRPDLPPGVGLVESFEALHNGKALPPGKKILFVLDQFEQWLLANRGREGTDLVKAFGHCDEERVQAILMVRDDFLAATIRFMEEIGIEFRTSLNAFRVDLFTPPHAEKVLAAFGRAYGSLRGGITDDQQAFLNQAVQALSLQDGKIVPVRLALFAERFKSRKWTPKTLQEIGDAEGVGVAFLEETFCSSYADPSHRLHQEAAQLVLRALLPETGTEIKRPSRPQNELLIVSSYASRPEKFKILFRILDNELRLITPIDQEGMKGDDGAQAKGSGEWYYQLTHDYLVPSLREWLARKNVDASQLVEKIRVAETKDVPPLVEQLAGRRLWANPLLYRIIEISNADSKERFHASLALLPEDDGQVEYLYHRLLKADPTELPVIRDALKQYRERLVERLWNVLEQPEEGQYLRAASALAVYDQSNPRWQEVGGKVAQAMVSVNAVHLGSWLSALRAAQRELRVPLAAIFRDKGHPETERSLALNILEDYASDQPNVLASLLMDSEENHFAVLFKTLKVYQEAAVPLLKEEMGKSSPEATEFEKDGLAMRQARAGVALVRLRQANEVWPKLQHRPDPRLRSFIVNWLAPLGVDSRTIADELARIDQNAKPTITQGQQAMDAILFHPETSIRRALILALGTYGSESLSPGERKPLIDKLLSLYQTDPDAGIHGAAEWTLRRWGQQDRLKERDDELMKVKDWGERRWHVNGRGQTFAVIEGPVEFDMGSPPTEPERFDDELLHKRVIPRRFAIATKGVTVEQYRQFQQASPDNNDASESTLKRYSPDDSGPMIVVTWYRAAAYCNWLSEQERIPKKEWCYVPNEKGRYAEGMTIPVNVLERRGYRLPTEAEWECACRAGSVTSRYYGHSEGLLGQYAWYLTNTRGDRTSPCGGLLPNDLGLFDLLGNVYEWCQDRSESYRLAQNNTIYDIINIDEYLKDTDPRLLRGGAFADRPAGVRSAGRYGNLPSYRGTDVGFRPARTYL